MFPLHNTLNKDQLIQKLEEETFERRTLSFYRYTKIADPLNFRDQLFLEFSRLNCLGRIYVAYEGINAQMSIPLPLIHEFTMLLESLPGMQTMPLKWAVQDDSKSFLKLVVKKRSKIVADGLPDDSFDVSDVGRHLRPDEFHRLSSQPRTTVVDMRNDYEYQIGHFTGAVNLKSDTFREAMEKAIDKLRDKKDEKILLYCTGGIRCEKASSWLKHHGFSDVNQLHGGIIEYARYIRKEEVASNFTGKNFVFDNRLGESIDGKIISNCHQCGNACDDYTNCANVHCHVLFLQCKDCASGYENCCSAHCQSIVHMSEEEKSAKSEEFLSNSEQRGFNNQEIRRRKFEKQSCSV